MATRRVGLLLAGLLAACVLVAPVTAGAKKPVLSWKVTVLDHHATYKLKALYASRSKGKAKVTVTGDCSISGKQLTTAADFGNCTVTVKVKAKGKFKQATITSTFTLLVCATGGTCQVGDTGPGGGKVFYDTGSTQPWGRYLEAAPADLDGSPTWGCAGTDVATGSAVGDGKANTTAILAACSTDGTASKLAAALTAGGRSDWYIPSLGELGLLRNANPSVPNIGSGGYWSSTQYSAGYGWFMAFVNGGTAQYGKDQGMSVRPIRAFSPSA